MDALQIDITRYRKEEFPSPQLLKQLKEQIYEPTRQYAHTIPLPVNICSKEKANVGYVEIMDNLLQGWK